MKFLATFLFFILSFSLFSQAPNDADCGGALSICNLSFHEPSPGNGQGNFPGEIDASATCVAGEDNAAWYTFTANSDGFLNFLITPDNPNDDYDWVLFDITYADCGDIFDHPELAVSCNAAGGDGCHGPTGPNGGTTYSEQGGGCGTDPPTQNAGLSPFNDQIPMTAGNNYALMVSNWTGSQNGYTIDFSNSTGLGTQDQVPPTVQSVEPPTDCITNFITVTFSENIQCSSITAANFQITGTGGPFTVTLTSPSCSAGGDHDRVFTITTTPPLPSVGNFNFSLITNGTTQVLDLCGNPAASWNTNFSTNNSLDNPPTIDPNPQTICADELVEIFPLSSNGLGSNTFTFFSDAGLNNVVHTGTDYSFTANTSLSLWVIESSQYCESPPVQYSLTVYPLPLIPDVVDPDPICQGDPIGELTAFGSGQGTFSWYAEDPTNGNPPVIATGSTYSPPNSTNTPSTLTFYVTEESLAHCVSEPAQINVTIVEIPPAPQLDQTVEICVGDDAPSIMIMELGGLITWYDSDPDIGNANEVGNGNPFTPPLDINTPASTDFYVTETDNNGCKSPSNYVTVVVNPLPMISDTTIDCAADVQTYSVTIQTVGTESITVNEGTIQDNGSGNFTISGIDINSDLVITANAPGGSCNAMFTISAPNCGCPDIAPPVSDGEQQICVGDIIQALSVTVPDGMTVDWYDANTGGNLLLANSTTFTPTAAGIYFAETHQLGGSCTSNSRTAISLVIAPLPNILDTVFTCAPDLASYSVLFIFDNVNSILDNNAGVVTNPGVDTFEITAVNSGTDLSFSAAQTTTGCRIDVLITAPDCSCPAVTAPVSLGDRVICEGDVIPALEVSVNTGETVNWYDAAVDGTLLMADTSAFTPLVAGTYYAETSVVLNGCISDVRTPVTLTINALPELQDTIKNCAADLLTYNLSVLLSTGDSLAASTGTIVMNTTTNYTISDIDVADSIRITLFDNTTNCENSFWVTAPTCTCDFIIPPVNLETFSTCEGAPLPEIGATVNAGLTIDWYDQPIGGNLVAEGTLAFTPDSLGIYYAESRSTENGCTSDTRLAVSLTEDPLPILMGVSPTCSVDLLSYSTTLIFENTDTLLINSGVLNINGSGSFDIIGVPISDTLFITAINQSTSCQDDFILPPPDCDCLAVAAPVSDGDQVICEGENMPALSVMVNAGETVDWYDAIIDGNLLLQNSNSFLPTEAGTYFAETRDLSNDCVSSGRTGVALTINPLPVLQDTLWTCAADLATYSSTILANNADSILVNAGLITNNGNGNFEVTGIPINTALMVTLINIGTNCSMDYSFPLPECECPDVALPVSLGDKEICVGDPIPTLVVTTTAGITIDWYDAATGGNLLLSDAPDFTPISPGSYFAEARAIISNCVSDTRTMVQLIENELPVPAVVSTTNPGCGLDNGSLTIMTSQGEAPYSYQLIGGATQDNGTFNNLSGTVTHSFIITDNNGCVATLDSSLVSPAGPEAHISEGDTLTCALTSFTVDAGGTNADGGVTFEWLLDGTFISDFIQIDINDPGQYVLVVHQDQCIDKDTLNVVEINEVDLNVDISTEEELNCVINTVTLDGSLSSSGDNINYQWYFNNTIIPGANDNTYEATQAGSYKLELREIQTGCTQDEVFTLVKNETYPVADAGDDQTIDCVIDEVTLNGSNSTGEGNLNFQWYTLNVAIDGATNPTYVTQQVGNYQLEVTNMVNQCKDSDEVVVAADTLSPTANAGADRTLNCTETELALDGSNSASINGLSYQWQTTSGEIISGETTPTPLIGKTGDYTLLVTDLGNGCTDMDVASVDKITEIETKVLVSAKDVGCSGEQNGYILLSPENAEAALTYSINNGSFSTNGNFSNLEEGDYFLLVEDVNGCQWDTTLTLLAGRDLSVRFDKDLHIRYGDSAQLLTILSVPYDTTMAVTWTNDGLLACKDCLQPWSIPLFETTDFYVTVTDENGCSDTEKITVFVDVTKQVFVPNAFSPNGDGINDVLFIQSGSDVVNVPSFQIFNRWGESVFEAYNILTNDPDSGWDGKYRGHKANAAVYVYSIEVEFIDGEKKLFSGEFVLIK